jgi:hypothetical protein
MTFHLTERHDTIWLAAKYPKYGGRPGAANKLLKDLGPDRAEAESILNEFQRRVPHG